MSETVKDYSAVTEQWDAPVSPTQLAMAACRYAWAARVAAGGSFLEVGCGAGIGLDVVARTARRVTGGDVTFTMLAAAKRRRPDRGLVGLDAMRLPFADASFDVVAAFETIYYFADQAAFVAEAKRVLTPGGRLLISAVNPQAPGFHASPMSTHYPTAAALRSLLEPACAAVTVCGGFPAEAGGALERAVIRMTNVAMALHLVPRTLEGRARIKRALYGKLPSMESLPDAKVTYPEPVELGPSADDTTYRVLYASGTMPR
jgi:SAM-dependent methyltransferase